MCITFPRSSTICLRGVMTTPPIMFAPSGQGPAARSSSRRREIGQLAARHARRRRAAMHLGIPCDGFGDGSLEPPARGPAEFVLRLVGIEMQESGFVESLIHLFALDSAAAPVRDDAIRHIRDRYCIH